MHNSLPTGRIGRGRKTYGTGVRDVALANAACTCRGLPAVTTSLLECIAGCIAGFAERLKLQAEL
eukprot:891273-Lingulodinium_polyedra.AAC.1